MTYLHIKCTRCRHACMESDWIDIPSKDFGGCTQKTCPRCGCKSYYDTTPQVAWCWASGLIEIGEHAPAYSSDGSAAIVIAEGPKYALKGVIDVAARHGQGALEGKLLVPGIPDAPNDKAALRALDQWLEWNRKFKRGRRDGVVWTEAVNEQE
jgi:hypothetical protein